MTPYTSVRPDARRGDPRPVVAAAAVSEPGAPVIRLVGPAPAVVVSAWQPNWLATALRWVDDTWGDGAARA